jgi:hypothetical protein
VQAQGLAHVPKIKNPRSKLRGIGGRKEADQKNAASCGEYVPKEIQSSEHLCKLAPIDAIYGVLRTKAVPSPLALNTPLRECHCPGKSTPKLSVSLNDTQHFDKEMSLCFTLFGILFRRGRPNMT